jgi:2-oxoisovalerate dehydrogenase E1 component
LSKILTAEFDEALRLEIKKDIDESLALANAEPEIEASLTEELNDVYKPFVYEEVKPQQKKKTSVL